MTPLPHDLATERAVLGRMMVRSDVVPDVAQTLTAGDFHFPPHGRIYAALVQGWQEGQPLDAQGVDVTLRDPDIPFSMLADMLVNAPAHHERLVRELIGLRIRRDIIIAAAEATEAARDLTREPLEALDHANQAMTSVDAPSETVRDLWYMDTFIDQPATSDPWVIPGLFRAGWRAVVVATEGVGKSYLSRQIAMAASAGVHPLCFEPMPPITTLVVDLENPAGQIAKVGRQIRDAVRREGTWAPERSFVWHRPGGIDIRRRGDRAQLENVIARCRPQFVTIGPLYKAYSQRATEGHELPAGEVQHALDDLRTRYGFALLLEHHAPKAQGNIRDILPYGSSLWLRWPELGLKLIDTNGDGKVLKVGRWRADRMDNAWPDSISRGTTWPWTGTWDRPYREAMEAVA